MRQILVVEDNKEINDLIATTLEKEGYQVHQTFNAIDALNVFRQESIDCIITDLMLPIMTGEDFIEEVRQESDVHIIVVSAKTSITDKLEGLRKGADDYLYKPFVSEEIVYKLNNLFKKLPQDQTKSYRDGLIRFEEGINQIFINDQVVPLTSVEYRMMNYLLNHPNKVISREQFLDVLYDFGEEVFDRVVDVHIKNIRQKIKQHTDETIIKTVYGLGYQFVGDANE